MAECVCESCSQIYLLFKALKILCCLTVNQGQGRVEISSFSSEAQPLHFGFR